VGGESRRRTRVIDARPAQGPPRRKIAPAFNGGFGSRFGDRVYRASSRVWEDALAACGGAEERVVFFWRMSYRHPRLGVDTRRMHYDNLTLMSPFHYRPRDVRRAYEFAWLDAR